MKNSLASIAFVCVALTASPMWGQSPPPGSVAVLELGDGIHLEFSYIPAATFLMGSPEDASWKASDEVPQHEVTLSKGFYLGRTEVTQKQWKTVMGTDPWEGQEGAGVRTHSDHPAVFVSWHDAQAFLQKLNEAAGKSVFRLPTEAEWEYACRAGTTTRWAFGDDLEMLGDYAWTTDNAWVEDERYAHGVATSEPNPWGLHDMYGNVYEWCDDWKGPYTTEAALDPKGPESGQKRVFRGGSIYTYGMHTASSTRGGWSPEVVRDDVGLRILVEVDPATLGTLGFSAGGLFDGWFE